MGGLVILAIIVITLLTAIWTSYSKRKSIELKQTIFRNIAQAVVNKEYKTLDLSGENFQLTADDYYAKVIVVSNVIITFDIYRRNSSYEEPLIRLDEIKADERMLEYLNWILYELELDI